jgi:hypothetical protein
MSNTNISQPSWKKFENFEGPDEDVRTRALRARRAKEGHGGNTFEGVAADGSAQRCKMGQKIGKFRLK